MSEEAKPSEATQSRDELASRVIPHMFLIAGIVMTDGFLMEASSSLIVLTVSRGAPDEQPAY